MKLDIIVHVREAEDVDGCALIFERATDLSNNLICEKSCTRDHEYCTFF